MSRRRVVAVVGSFAVAGALLLTTRGAAERAKHSIDSGVLRVESRGCSRTVLGSGFLVDRTHLVTAAHVVDGADSIVLTRDGRVVAHGTIFGTDAASDVALIRLDNPVPGHALTLSTHAPKQGDDAFAVGYPLGEPLTVAHGSVRGAASTVPSAGIARRPLIQTDAPVSHGESGGPLVSADGAVLGMVDMSSTRGGGPSFAVGARDFASLISRWRSDREAVPQRPCRATGGYPTLPPPAHM